MIPKVDTFEHDISDEIRRKEASLTDISAASNDVGNNDTGEVPKKSPVLMIAIIVFVVLSVIGFGILGYLYSTDPATTPPGTQPTTGDPAKKAVGLEKISPTLANAIGRFVTSVDKKEKGYVLVIDDYAQVFAYMTRNESAYIEELASLFPPISSSNNATSTKPSPVTGSTTPTGTASTTQASSTPTSSSTKPIAESTTTAKLLTTSTTTKTGSSPETALEKVASSPFSDITISNQNMRVWKSDTRRVVYSFINNKAVVVSDSPEGILYLKSAILK